MRFIYIFFSDKMKLDIAIQKFIKYRNFVQKISQISKNNDRGALSRFHEFLFTKYSRVVDVEEISFDDFIDYSEFMGTATFRRWRSLAKKVKLSHNSIVKHQQIVRIFLKRCYQNKLLQTDFGCLKIWKIERRENASVLSHDEIKQFFELAEQNTNKTIWIRDSLLFRVAYYTWLRRTEILNLTFEQLLCDDQFQLIGKNARARTVYFDSESRIRELALELRYLYSKIFPMDWNDFVFRSVANQTFWKQLSQGSVYFILMNYKKKIWIDPNRRLTLHSFRHTFATTLLENWANLREVQVLLGHASIRTTEFYTHIPTIKLRACSSLLHLS